MWGYRSRNYRAAALPEEAYLRLLHSEGVKEVNLHRVPSFPALHGQLLRPVSNTFDFLVCCVCVFCVCFCGGGTKYTPILWHLGKALNGCSQNAPFTRRIAASQHKVPYVLKGEGVMSGCRALTSTSAALYAAHAPTPWRHTVSTTLQSTALSAAAVPPLVRSSGVDCCCVVVLLCCCVVVLLCCCGSD